MSTPEAFQDKIEHARLLARFKLGVKRQLDVSVSLDRLENEPDYAGELFDQQEERIQDEDLLTTLLVLRRRIQANAAHPPLGAEPVAVKAVSPQSQRYLFGPRS